MATSDADVYRQNAASCEARAEELAAAGNVLFADLYRRLAFQWRSMAEQVEQQRF